MTSVKTQDQDFRSKWWKWKRNQCFYQCFGPIASLGAAYMALLIRFPWIWVHQYCSDICLKLQWISFFLLQNMNSLLKYNRKVHKSHVHSSMSLTKWTHPVPILCWQICNHQATHLKTNQNKTTLKNHDFHVINTPSMANFKLPT